MNLATFKEALKLGDYVGIGGGEPTLHPLFEQFLMLAIASSGEMPFIVTNGSIKERALLIAKLTRLNVLEGYLSLDQYHDRSLVSKEVIKAFKDIGEFQIYGKDYRPKSNVIPSGRGKKLGGTSNNCCCESLFVTPRGNLRQCGCPNAPKVGTVWTGAGIDYFEECYRNRREAA
jgi:hypothetical protein